MKARTSSIALKFSTATAAAALCLLQSFPSFAQEAEDPVETEPRPEMRTVGEIQTKRSTLTDRTPIRARSVTASTGSRRKVDPPRPRDTGFVPRLAISADAQDNLFFTSEDKTEDLILAISPGINFVEKGKRWNVAADYAFESALYTDNDDLNDAFDSQAATVTAGYELSQRTQVQVVNVFLKTQDPTAQPIPGAAAGTSGTTNNFADISLAHDLTRRLSLEVRYGYEIGMAEDDASTDIKTHDWQGAVARVLSPRSKLRLDYRNRIFDFEGVDENVHSGGLEYTYDIASNWTIFFDAGAAVTTIEDEEVQVRGRAGSQVSLGNVSLEFGFERDVGSVVGLDDLLISNSGFFEARVPIGQRLELDSRLELARFKTLEQSPLEVDEIDISVGMSYAITDKTWLQSRYIFTGEDIKGSDFVPANRFIVGVAQTL